MCGVKGWMICTCAIVIWIVCVGYSEGRPSYCMKPPAHGNCTDDLMMFFYLPEKDTCEMFLYGGCPVNKNVFDDAKKCMEVCGRRRQLNNETGVEEIVDEPDEFSDESDEEEEEEVTLSPPSPAPGDDDEQISLPPPRYYLTLGEESESSTFTFANPTSYIQIGPHEISRYQIRNRRSISLQFRTRSPHAILAYHGIKNRPSDINKYELYVMLDQGQLKVKHLFGDYSTTLVVGKGLNRDRWHTVLVTIDPGDRKIIASVDNEDTTAQIIDGLRENYLYGADNVELESVVFIGGLSTIVGLDISYLAKTFVGCVRNVTLETSPLKTAPLEPISDLVASHFKDVKEECISKCWEQTVKCSRDSKCINFYDHVECDCFQARFKGEKCKEPNIPQLTLFGYSYVTFTVFEWMDRVHSDDNRISMQFQTQMDDSILFYASGEIPMHNHVAVSIINGSVFVDIDFGNDDQISRHLTGRRVTDSRMHTLTITHEGKNVTIQLDRHIEHHVLTGPNIHLHINPDVYVGGGGPTLKNRKTAGLMSSNNFVGCLQEVYFNMKAILYELQENNLQARHHGLTPPAFGQCTDQHTVPITIPFAESGFRIANPNSEQLELRFAFRTNELYGTLAFSEIKTLKGQGFWELKFGVDEVIFEMHPDKAIADISQPKNLTVKYNKSKGKWNSVELSYKNGEIKLTSGTNTRTEVFLDMFQLSQLITLGTSQYKPKAGFKGCMRRIEIAKRNIDSRHIVGSDDQIGDIALDNCQFIDPCHRPDVCEHGGKCQVENDQVNCDCNATGYIGKRCHFATFKRTCEELALLGYKESGVYKIDIDGNGPYPPSHVKCKFEHDPSGETKTIVEHNLANETDVWSPNDADKASFKLQLTYREFSSDMLLSLISQSVQCSQHIKYDCYKAKLGLFQYTWFKPADPKESRVVSIGDASRGSCPCSKNLQCAKGHHCNCDSIQDKWLHDEGYFTTPERLGVTEMSFVVPKNLPPDAASRITLGPLECVEANTQRYVVTFKTFGSYLEAPGWKSGDLAFSFRTTRSSAILLFQPLLYEKHSAFSVFLTNDYELTFQYVLGGNSPQEVTVRSEQRLSNGEWQQVWIDFDLHEVRFQINRHHEMITLPDAQQFGPFEGTMYIAGAPENYLEKAEKAEVKEGLIGCFRGLVMNGQVLNLYSYMKFHKADIIKDCSPSCDPNPCQHDAHCQENWGSFECQCSNPFAHKGILCEEDINVDGLTFLSQSSFIIRQSLDSQPDPIKKILTSNIYLNIRTYDSEALVLYANDNLNNFVQIHVEDETKVVFTWNEHDRIRRIAVNQKRLNHGIPVQIAVVRNATHTTLHVNDHAGSKPVAVALLESYSEKPWINPELERFTPPRPFAPISPYYQMLLGGFDSHALKPTGNSSYFPGMLGCLNGLSIGNVHITISDMANRDDVLNGCKMVCDATPCDHGGICLEDFTKRTYTCDCTFTSYYGQHCDDEKGATFQGESLIMRRFENELDEVNEIEARFGFTTITSAKDTILLTVQIPGQSYSLVFSLNQKGKLILRETQGSSVEGATIKHNFADGTRHSVYYKRTPEETIFIVDQEEILVTPFSAEFTFFNPHVAHDSPNVGEVFVGGVSDSVPDLKYYQRFNGCYSNIYVKVNNRGEIRPVDEYMGFVKKPVGLVFDVEKVEGIKLRCEPMFLPTGRIGVGVPAGDATPDWITGLPKKKNITIKKPESLNNAGFSFDTLALILAIFFGILIVSVGFYVYKVNKRYRRRKLYEDDEDDLYYTHRGPAHYYGPKSTEIKYPSYRKTNPDSVELLNNAAVTNNVNNSNHHAPVKTNVRALYADDQEEGTKLIEEIAEENEDEDDDTTSQNESGSNKSSSNSELDHQALDDKDDETLPEEDEDDDGIENSGIRKFPPIEEVTTDDNESETAPANSGAGTSSPPEQDVLEEGDNENHKEPDPSSSSRPLGPGPMSPVFINEHARIFETSPIAIIGGPRYQQMKRASKDSIISLD